MYCSSHGDPNPVWLGSFVWWTPNILRAAEGVRKNPGVEIPISARAITLANLEKSLEEMYIWPAGATHPNCNGKGIGSFGARYPTAISDITSGVNTSPVRDNW